MLYARYRTPSSDVRTRRCRCPDSGWSKGAAGEEHLSHGGVDDGMGPAVRVLLRGKQAAMTRADVAATVNGLGVGPPAVCSGCWARALAGSEAARASLSHGHRTFLPALPGSWRLRTQKGI